MFPNYKSKYHDSLPQHSNFKEERVRQHSGNHIALSAKTGSFTTNISAFNISLSDEFTQKKCYNRKKELYCTA